MELRPYQQKAVDSIFKSWGEFDKTLLVLPTGCHAKGSQILLFDGRHGVTKNVENVEKYSRFYLWAGIAPRRAAPLLTKRA